MRLVRAALALWLCLGLLPAADILRAAQQPEHECAHGHKNCQCPGACDRSAPQADEGMAGMACHRKPQAAAPAEPAAPIDGPCWRSCSSQDEAFQATPRAFYLSAGDLVAAGVPWQTEPAALPDFRRPPAGNPLPPAPPPRNG